MVSKQLIATLNFFLTFSLDFVDLLSSNAAQPNLPANEINTLRNLYDATNGNYWLWTNLTPYWNFSGDPNPCAEKWWGVTCFSRSLRVSNVFELNLISFNLTGSIPASITLLPGVKQISLHDNSLTGSVPVYFSASLRALDLSNNLLRYQTAASICTVYLNYLNLSTNKFKLMVTPVPNCSLSIRVLDLSNNHIEGTLPAQIAELTTLSYLSVASNALDGTLPKFAVMPLLRVLLLSRNQFRGTLSGVFGGSNQSDLSVVEINNNHLTGTLPRKLFGLRSLTTLVAARNCFHGTLSEKICSQTRLQTVILDGLHASSACADNLQVGGTIPRCIFSLPNLQSLHLSGNNFLGTLPQNNVTLANNFTQLTLSHNAIRGKIPSTLQNHAWALFDLSYNFFNGTLDQSFGAATLQRFPVEKQKKEAVVLRIKNNRLSGSIPAPLLDYSVIDVLGSNMFSCNAHKSDIPDSDGDKDKYQCGSDAFDYSFYVFLGLALMVACIVAGISYSGGSREVTLYLDKWRLPKGSLPRSCQHVHTMVGILCQVALYTTVLTVLVFVPWYTTAGYYWGTYTHQYAYIVSAAFLSGLAPGIAEFFLQAALVLVVAIITAWITLRTENDERVFAERRSSAQIRRDSQLTEEHKKLTLTARMGAYAAFLVINLTAVVGAYVAFIYISVSNVNVNFIRLAGIALSILKFLWNTVCVPKLVYAIAEYYHMPVKQSGGFFRVQSFIGLFNNIAIPCIVVAAQSSSCFYNVLYPEDSVVSQFVLPACAITNGVPDCKTLYRTVLQTIYRPTFHYSYQCSSSFITYYAPSMITFALTPMIIVPIINLASLWILRRTRSDSALHKIAEMALPQLWKDITPVNPAAATELVADKQVCDRGTYLDASTLLINMNIYLGIILTFGVAFPPIAVAMCAAMFSVAIQTKLAVGRLLCEAREVGRQDIIDALEKDCAKSASLEKLKSIIMASIASGCYFYALFIFDTIGDAVGWRKAYWVLILMPLFPACVYGYVRLRRMCAEKSGAVKDLGYSMDGRVLEMTDMSRGGKDVASDSNDDGVGTVLNAIHAKTYE